MDQATRSRLPKLTEAFAAVGNKLPEELAAKFPRIVEKIDSLWGKVEVMSYLDSVLMSERGGRKGFDEAVLKDQRGEDFTRRELDELHLFHRAAHFRRDNEAGAGREAGEERGGLFENFGDGAVLRGARGFDTAAVILREIAELHQAVDVKADALFGW